MIAPRQSGLFVRGEVRDAAILNSGGEHPLLIVARNNDDLLLFQKAF